MSTTRRRKRTRPASNGPSVIDMFKHRLTNPPDPRSHAEASGVAGADPRWSMTNSEFLADMRAEQAAGRLANPATAALLERLEMVIR